MPSVVVLKSNLDKQPSNTYANCANAQILEIFSVCPLVPRRFCGDSAKTDGEIAARGQFLPRHRCSTVLSAIALDSIAGGDHLINRLLVELWTLVQGLFRCGSYLVFKGVAMVDCRYGSHGVSRLTVHLVWVTG